MDVTRMLEADHRMVEGLFSQIESAKGQERRTLVDELATALRSHMELEETVVYPQVASTVGEEPVQEGNKEHELARKTLQDLLALAPDEPGFGAALDSLKAGIEHHVHEEEDEVFPKLRREGGDAVESMAEPFLAKRQELGMKVNTAALVEGATKEQLEEEAKGLDIEGTSSMDKQELAQALASAG